jgi:polysaccharide deacetylase family protein (PEP-CTERM system associated)
MTDTPIDPRVTFTLDLEDHRPVRVGEERYPAITRTVLAFLADRSVRGTFFVTGEILENQPDLVREVVASGHEVAFHGFHHVPFTQLEPDQLREEAKRAKGMLEDLSGQEVVGFRAPQFSVVPESRWAIDVLGELGFTYSSSVLPARSPLFGDPTAPTTPFRWPNGVVELPCPVASMGGIGLPYLGGVYLRTLPRAAQNAARRVFGRGQLLWIYCHPYDFDTTEPFWVVPEVGRLGSRLLWYNRDRAFAKIDALLAGGAAPPLGERIGTLELPEYPPETRGEYTQLDMVHRLPRAELVNRFDYLTELAAGKRVIHVGFADIGCQSLNEEADAWLHDRLASSARELVGLDIDEHGVELARARGYEAHVVDCSDADAVAALGLAPADVVVAGEVIEHIDDAGSFLDGLHALVKKDGMLIITTPNASSLSSTLAAFANLEVNHPDHVSMFTPYTLDAMLLRHCWEPVEHAVFVYQVKTRADGTLRGRTLTLGGRVALQSERVLARLGRPYLARGLIAVARSTAP